MRRLFVLVLPALLVLLPTMPVSAAASPSCGEVVRTNVTLTRDLLNCPADGLVVGANSITIDLNGHRITGTSSGGPGGANYCPCGINDTGGYSHLVLNNGSIEGFHEGAQFLAARDITVRAITSRNHWDDGILFDHVVNAVVADSDFAGSYRGVEAYDSRNVVVRSTTESNIQHAGVAFFRTTDSVVRNVTMTLGGGDYGVEVANSSRNLITQNQIRRWGSDGIVIVGVSAVGPQPASDNTVTENDLRNGLSTGIELIEVDGGTVHNNTVGANDILAAPDDGILIDAVTSVNGDGFPPFVYLVGVGPSGNRIRGNTANGHGRDGIHLDAPSNVVTANVANHNANWGIYAVPGNVDGGGNRASGNGQPTQCLGVSCSR